MREQLVEINQCARKLYDLTKGRDTISRENQKLLQDIIDDMQRELDAVIDEQRRADLNR